MPIPRWPCCVTPAQRIACLSCNAAAAIRSSTTEPPQKRLQACKSCESLTFKRALSKAGLCPSCRIDKLAIRAAESAGMTLELQGDPRGAPFYVHTADGRKYAVPARPSTNRW